MMPIYEDLPFQIWFEDGIPEQFFTPTDYLLFYVIRGKLLVDIDQRAYTFCENDLFIVHPGEAYKVHEGKGYLFCTVRMSFGFLLRCCDYERPFFYTESYGHRLLPQSSNEGSRPLIDKIEALAEAFFSVPRPSASRLIYLFFNFAYFLIEHYKTIKNHGSATNRRIYQIRDYIETSYHMPITLNSLAEALGITPQYLSGFIKKQLGVTFVVYLNKVRLNHAAYDLVHTTENVTQIMYKNGFPNATAFNESFKKCYGTTPVEYRRALWAKNDGQVPAPPDNDFASTARRLYKDFITDREKQRRKQGYVCRLSLDSNGSSYMGHPWCKVLNTGSFINVLNIDYYAQIELIQNHLQFKFARVTGVCAPTAAEHFLELDSAIDALRRTGLVPWLVIEGTDQEDDMETQLHLAGRLLKHGSDRYGRSFVSGWRIEYAMGLRQTFEQYLNNWKKLFSIVKSFHPGLMLGGPSWPMDALPVNAEILFSFWQSQQCVPDFISLTAWPYLRPEQGIGSISINESRLRTFYQKARRYFGEYNSDVPPIDIVDSGFVRSDNNYLNDSLFMGNYLLKNYSSLQKYVEFIASPPLSDLTHSHGSPHKEAVLLQGGRGLLTANGIFKPAFFALKYLSQLGENCLHMGENHWITENTAGEMVILLYNYKHPDAYYCRHPSEAVSLSQTSIFFSDRSEMQFQLDFPTLEAPKYQVTKFLLNEHFGSILDCMAAFGNITALREDTLNYLRGSLWPRLWVQELENDHGLTIRETIAPQEIIMLHIVPL